jgi:aminoglycoside phosphotransferase (APT) family kinase protein
MTHDLARASAEVPRILASAADDLPRAAAGATIADAHVTSTRTAVIRLAVDREPPCLVVKLPLSESSARRLAREHRALTALHADERLDGWSVLAPRCLHTSASASRPATIETAVPGRSVVPALRRPATRPRTLEAAAEAIGVLHARSAREAAVDDAAIARWVDEPVRTILAGSRTLAGAWGDDLRRLAGDVTSALHGQVVPVTWIHGDAWAGNLLAEPGDAALTGIVDWDAAAADALPLHDVLHGLLFARRVTSGRQLGQIVRDQLRGPDWDRAERGALSRYGDAWAAGLSHRHALALYWLRQMALHADQQGSRAGVRHGLWDYRNVRPVVAAWRP